MELAKAQLDIGTMVGDWEAADRFWSEAVGLTYEKFEKLGGGVRQHRFGSAGSVIKVNHSRAPLTRDETVHRRLRLARPGCAEPVLLRDPEGVEVELVPPGHDGIAGLEVVNATADAGEAERFWVQGLGGTVVGPGRIRVGDSLVRLVAEAGLRRPSSRTAAGLRYLTVQVLDVDAAYARLVGLGFIGEIAPVSLGATARISFVRDPAGGYVELSQLAEFTGRPIPPGDPGIVVP